MNHAMLSALPGVFNRWQVDAIPPDGVSYDISLERASLRPAVWSMELPANYEDARANILQADSDVQKAGQVVQQLPNLYDDLVKNARQGGNDTAFSIQDQDRSGSYQELQRWMGAFDAGTVSFGEAGLSSVEFRGASQSLQQTLTDLTHQVQNLAWVETKSEGVLLARSVVGWNGTTNTGFASLSAQQASLHHQSLLLALASRFVLLNLVVSVIGGAGKLAVLITAPGAALLALPAAWRIATRIISEAAHFRQQI